VDAAQGNLKMYKLGIYLLLGYMLGAGLYAQSSGGKPPNVRFVAQALPDKMGQVVMRVEEKESDPFDLPMNNLTSEMKAPGRLFNLVLAGGTRPIGVVQLPPEGSSFIVLLLTLRKDRYDAVVLPDKGTSFRPGDVYLHNTSGVPVLGQIGDKRFTLTPGKGRIHTPTGAVDETYYDVGFLIKEEDGSNRFLSTSRWPVSDRTRSYVFFFKDPSTQRIGFRAVDELIPLAE
jgi:hypothetical protein